MNTQPTPDRNPEERLHSEQPEELSNLQSVPARLDPVVITYRGAELKLTVDITLTEQPRVEAVKIEALDSSGKPVVAFLSKGPIHYRFHQAILQGLKRGVTAEPLSGLIGAWLDFGPMKVLELAKEQTNGTHTHVVATNIYELLTNYSPIEWDIIILKPAASSTNQNQVLTPVIPSLAQLIERPKILEEHFESRRVLDDRVDRLAIRLYPEEGYATVSLETKFIPGDETRSNLWKVIPDDASGNNLGSVKHELLREATGIATVFRDAGCDGVAEFLQSERADAFEIPAGELEQDYLDHIISNGMQSDSIHKDKVDERQLSSGASAELTIGVRCATISIQPSPDCFLGSHRFVFYCSSLYSQLTAPQIRHIRKIFNLLTSPRQSDRDTGIQISRAVKDKQAEQAVPSYVYNKPRSSSDALLVDRRHAVPDINQFLGLTDTARLFSIKGIDFSLPASYSPGALSSCLDGARGFMVELKTKSSFPAHPELFHHMHLELLNDSTVRVILTGRIAGSYATLIPKSQQHEFVSPIDAMVSLCELFARQPEDSWVPLLSEIQRLENDELPDADTHFWDPRRESLPPVTDTVACGMFDEAAKIHSQLSTGWGRYQPKYSTRYLGPGTIELYISRLRHLPSVALTLANGYLRQVTLYHPVGPHLQDRGRGPEYARFESDTLAVGSSSFREIIDAFALTLQPLLGASDTPATEHETAAVLAPLTHVAGEHMNKTR